MKVFIFNTSEWNFEPKEEKFKEIKDLKELIDMLNEEELDFILHSNYWRSELENLCDFIIEVYDDYRE